MFKDCNPEQPTDEKVTRLRMALLPCPFCGADENVWDGVTHDDYDAYPDKGIEELHTVTCLRCHCYGPLAKTPEEAARKWNSRLIIQRSQPLAPKLRLPDA